MCLRLFVWTGKIPSVPALLDKRLVVVTGKGGVGKTTVAVALGLAAARAGKRTMVAEVAQQERVSRVFRREGLGYSEAELAPNLFGMSIDPERALKEYLGQQVGGALGSVLTGNRIFDYFAAAAPGVRELATVGKVWELSQAERRDTHARPYDIVIMDAPASGHGLALLKSPRTFGDIARVGPIRRRADMIHDFLTDGRRTGVVAVALPQEMPVNETLEFREKLRTEMGMDTHAVVVNSLLPERFSAEEAERIEAVNGDHGSPEVAAALRAALSEQSRARGQRAQLRRLKKGADEVVTLPYLFEPELGLAEFERLSAELERKIA
jgi:anion-transporting  ArsA/GET3 family ATPase